VESNFLLNLAIDIGIALGSYLFAVHVLYWQMPRRKHVLLGTLVAFAGTMLGRALFAGFDGGAPLEGLGAVVGAFALTFIAVKLGTPGSVVLTIDTEGVSGHGTELAREGFAAPFVWPYHFNVEKYGSVVFDLVGKPGTVVTVEFPPEKTPFGNDRNGKPRATFTETVPGRINASPTILSGRGKYLIRMEDPTTRAVTVNDPTWDVPRKKD
jgi:hypothetical protein